MLIEPADVQERMDEVPFQPFTITMSDGRQFTIVNHDSASVGENAVMVAIGLNEHKYVQRWVRCVYGHITSLEDAKPQPPTKRRAKAAKP